MGYLYQSLGRIFQALGYLYQDLGYKITARENNFYGGGNKLLWRASATLVEPIVYRQFYPYRKSKRPETKKRATTLRVVHSPLGNF